MLIFTVHILLYLLLCDISMCVPFITFNLRDLRFPVPFISSTLVDIVHASKSVHTLAFDMVG
jgi:hypothetical protein